MIMVQESSYMVTMLGKSKQIYLNRRYEINEYSFATDTLLIGLMSIFKA